MEKAALLRSLPAVERVLNHPEALAAVEGGMPRQLLAEAARDVLGFLRRSIQGGEEVEASINSVAQAALDLAGERQRPKIRKLINATGTVLHTNLGRAPLAQEAIEAMIDAAGYCNIEYDLESGGRGSRHAPLRNLICELTGAEDAIVVNNCAAAVMLALAALARGREVVVSRGQLVEIGGAFRVPEVMSQSGAKLKEVGTTNKTRIGDYHHAIGPDTAALMKVHTSNFRVVGFTEEASLAELVDLARGHNLWVIEDLGSGLLIPIEGVDEPTVSASIEAGADIVTFSGDKLLGGPQAGIIAGRLAAVETLARHPLMRALRPDKVTLAALEATLKLYRDPAKARSRVPALAILGQSPTVIAARANELADKIAGALGESVSVELLPDHSEAGGGTLPTTKFDTTVVAVKKSGCGVSAAEASLRRADPPIIARIRDDSLLFDARTISDADFDTVARSVAAAFQAE